MNKVKVDEEKCIGCGLCVALAEKTFKITDEGKVEVIGPTKDEASQIKESIESCPVGAIEEIND